jgi:pimeloyl-ACP methyl ester carboxylesterase
MPKGAVDPVSVSEYWRDVWQRWALFLETLNERGNIYVAQAAKEAPNVLSFPAEVVLDARQFPRPVNYVLVRIVPPADVEIDSRKPPIVVVDPRAGHGPGIGGMKPDSEIGVALRAGHAVYFVGFLPTPVSEQTVEDVCRAEARFLEEVAARHPGAEGRPIVIANCQAGWQIMMTAALRPDLFGAVMVAGTPLSYWAGVHGKNPMRYLGGVFGGNWLTAFAGDIGKGIFDGASLIANFESLNPANTYWTKPYNVYSKVDSETERFLEFETWWGSPVLLTAGEMQWITDNLFVGDKLATGQIRTSEGVRIDLRNIKSPIVCFCSWGDDITPPQQALDWILDLYDNVGDVVASGQTIVYCLHHDIGHLGIFVSGKVATKEHREFVTCMEMIEATPAGLYEAVITEVEEGTEHPDLIDGKYLFRLVPRTLDDIRALGGNSEEDEKRFATVARVSEINLGLYRLYFQPWIRAAVTEPMAEAMRATHPNRMRFEMFSDKNPFMAAVKPFAEWARQNRTPVSADNPLLAMEQQASAQITSALQKFGEMRDAATEAFFLSTYGSPVLQAMVGAAAPNGVERELVRETAAAEMRQALERKFDEGGAEAAVLRALIYVRRLDGAFDERGYRMLKALRERRKANERMTIPEFREIVNVQLQLVLMDEERAIAALPKLLEAHEADREPALEALRKLAGATGALSLENEKRLARVETLFGAPVPKIGARGKRALTHQTP